MAVNAHDDEIDVLVRCPRKDNAPDVSVGSNVALHDDLVRQEISRFRGREVKSLGDGVLATFDGPARAVRCGVAIVQRARPLGLEVRCGLHTGEIELKGQDITGIAVHIAARIAAQAQGGEVLVSRTVRDLMAGSNLRLEDRGAYTLKGLSESMALFAAVTERGT